MMGNPFIRTEGQLLFACCLVGILLEDLTSTDKLKSGDKGVHFYLLMTQYVARRQFWTDASKKERCYVFLEMHHVGDT